MATTEQVREHEKIELAASVLRSGGSVRLRVFGTSMLPSLWPGDLVAVENNAPTKFVPGDIVLLLRDRRFLAHRLLAQPGTQWITRGDAMPQNDPPAQAGDLLGRVVRVERHGRSLLPPPVSPLTRMLASILCHCDFVRSVALRLHSARQRYLEREVLDMETRAPLVTQFLGHA